jgi:hypothetical protein
MTIGAGVTLLGFPQDLWHFTFVIAAGATKADEGKPVTFDTSAANQMKLSADGDCLDGTLISLENRVQEGILVGTVALKGTFLFNTNGTVNVGDQVQAGPTGTVKVLVPTLESASAGQAIKATSYQKVNIVVEKPTGSTAVVILM